MGTAGTAGTPGRDGHQEPPGDRGAPKGPTRVEPTPRAENQTEKETTSLGQRFNKFQAGLGRSGSAWEAVESCCGWSILKNPPEPWAAVGTRICPGRFSLDVPMELLPLSAVPALPGSPGERNQDAPQAEDPCPGRLMEHRG